MRDADVRDDRRRQGDVVTREEGPLGFEAGPARQIEREPAADAGAGRAEVEA
jgi:hypothetical protein